MLLEPQYRRIVASPSPHRAMPSVAISPMPPDCSARLRSLLYDYQTIENGSFAVASAEGAVWLVPISTTGGCPTHFRPRAALRGRKGTWRSGKAGLQRKIKKHLTMSGAKE